MTQPTKSLTIALDFDDTYTADQQLWDEFARLATSRNHRVIVVTARRNTVENRDVVRTTDGLPVFFTGLKAKRWYLETTWNIRPDIWIDDQPDVIVNGI